MRPTALASWLIVSATFCVPSTAQTSTKCNPLQGEFVGRSVVPFGSHTDTEAGTCPADPALGKSTTIDFTKGIPSDFTASGRPTFDSNGASFSIAQSGDAPTLTSNWYIMFGHVEIVMKAAPGVGVVSTLVLQSDDLDEIDYEWLGGDDTQVQSNYFSKGQTTTYNRGAFHPNAGNHDGFHKYTVDWTAQQVVWQIDGVTVRALTQASTGAQGYPQTPMQIKIGAWSGGDPSNAPGTIAWAGGPTNYAGGPYTMQVKSIAVTDYSTGSQYTYGDTSGNWQSIKSSGGSINSGGNGSPAAVSAPAVTAVSNGAPLPFEGTHRDTTSTYTTPSGWPWVAGPTTLSTSVSTVTTIPGLPPGWTVNGSGKVVPPSAAPSTSPPALSTSSAAALPPASSLAAEAGYETVTQYNQQGFPTTIILPAGWATASKSYDGQGFLITPGPAAPSSTTGVSVGLKAADSAQSSTVNVLKTTMTGAASSRGVFGEVVGVCAFLVALVLH